MIGKTQTHDTSTSIETAAPAEVRAGTDLVLKVRVSCPFACDLRGKAVDIVTRDAIVVKQAELLTHTGQVNETDEFVVKAPIEPGRHTWTAVFPAQEKEGIVHAASSAALCFAVRPHAASIAVWDVPSPIELGNEFVIKVGVRCSAECKLTDEAIAIYDSEGAQVATGALLPGRAPMLCIGRMWSSKHRLRREPTRGQLGLWHRT